MRTVGYSQYQTVVITLGAAVECGFIQIRDQRDTTTITILQATYLNNQTMMHQMACGQSLRSNYF